MSSETQENRGMTFRGIITRVDGSEASVVISNADSVAMGCKRSKDKRLVVKAVVKGESPTVEVKGMRVTDESAPHERKIVREGMFVAVAGFGSDHCCATSTDGVTWTPQRNLKINNSWSSVCYGNGILVTVANNGVNPCCATSIDGVTWTPQTGFSRCSG